MYTYIHELGRRVILFSAATSCDSWDVKGGLVTREVLNHNRAVGWQQGTEVACSYGSILQRRQYGAGKTKSNVGQNGGPFSALSEPALGPSNCDRLHPGFRMPMMQTGDRAFGICTWREDGGNSFKTEI